MNRQMKKRMLKNLNFSEKELENLSTLQVTKILEENRENILKEIENREVGETLENTAYTEEKDMILKVNFKNGSSRDFVIDDYFISDNDICLYMRKDDRQVGMINLCEVRYFFVEEE